MIYYCDCERHSNRLQVQNLLVGQLVVIDAARIGPRDAAIRTLALSST